MLKTSWKVVTSEETSGSLLISVALGKIYFQNEATNDKMTIKYRCVSLGEGKGLPVGANWSNTSDPSGGVGNVSVADGRYFGSLVFPCHGYMFGLGGSSGVVGSIFNMAVTGGGLTEVLFGMLPVFAGVRMWGLGRAALPGGGISGGVAVFELDSYTTGT